jgi:small subunit ribosomal protein S5
MPKSRALPRRTFHASSILCERRRRPRFASVKAEDMGLVSRPTKEGLRPYEAEEKTELSKRYTPEQMRVIEAGEEAVDVEDIRTQGMFRNDPFRLPYLDDLSIIRPVIDKRLPEKNTWPENSRWNDDRESLEEFNRWMSKALDAEHRPYRKVPEDGSETIDDALPAAADLNFARAEFRKYMESAPGVTGQGSQGTSTLAPALPKIASMKGQYQNLKEADPRDPEGKQDFLIKQTGMSLDEIMDLKSKVLVNHRVVNQTRLGKIQSMYCLVVAGDGNGRLGIGEGKAIEPDEARDKAKRNAIRSMQPIPRYENRTIFGEVEGKVAACEVKLMARPPGMSGHRVKIKIAGLI